MHQREYWVEIRRCKDDLCAVCTSMAPLPAALDLDGIHHLPDPTPDPDRAGHYQKFDALYGTPTTNVHRPSYISCKNKSVTAGRTDDFTGQHFKAGKVRDTIWCSECGKHRLVYSWNVFSATPGLKAAFQDYRELYHYVCGAPLCDGTSFLHNKVGVKENLNCASPVEQLLYSSDHVPLELKKLCIRCGKSDPLMLERVTRELDFGGNKKPTVRP